AGDEFGLAGEEGRVGGLERGRVGQDGVAGLEEPALVGELFPLRLAGEAEQFEPVREVAEDVEGAGPDRPGGPEHGDPFRPSGAGVGWGHRSPGTAVANPCTRTGQGTGNCMTRAKGETRRNDEAPGGRPGAFVGVRWAWSMATSSAGWPRSRRRPSAAGRRRPARSGRTRSCGPPAPRRSSQPEPGCGAPTWPGQPGSLRSPRPSAGAGTRPGWAGSDRAAPTRGSGS